ncbi:MAG: hypothetical protein IIC57_08240 [Proteobacteria bacterium]|nr:hypothetical protein [Pseudomonadota bacterium]
MRTAIKPHQLMGFWMVQTGPRHRLVLSGTDQWVIPLDGVRVVYGHYGVVESFRPCANCLIPKTHSETIFRYTKSGKITELAVADIVHGREVTYTSALANPEALELYRDLEALRT